jgi:hypothetical protein
VEKTRFCGSTRRKHTARVRQGGTGGEQQLGHMITPKPKQPPMTYVSVIMRFCYSRHYSTKEVQDFWQNGKYGECIIDQKMVTVQGSHFMPSPLILTLIETLMR